MPVGFGGGDSRMIVVRRNCKGGMIMEGINMIQHIE